MKHETCANSLTSLVQMLNMDNKQWEATDVIATEFYYSLEFFLLYMDEEQ